MKTQRLMLFLCVLFLGGCGGHDHTHYQGYVEGENLYLAVPYEGSLVKKYVSRGQQVKKGDLLFQLNTNPELLLIEQLKAELAQAKSSLIDLKKPKRGPEINAIQQQIEQADASLILADIREKRYTTLYRNKATELDRVDEATSLKRSNQAIKNQYEQNLILSKMGARPDQIQAQEFKWDEVNAGLLVGEWKLAQKTVRAPGDAIVFDTYYQEGEFIAAGRPIAALLLPKNVRIEFFIPAQDLPQLQLNQSIQFTCAGCAETNEAVVSYISPEAEYVPPLVYTRDNLENLVFRVKAQIKNPASFKPGQPVTVSVAHAQ
jgi:HlyD family secretion protein